MAVYRFQVQFESISGLAEDRVVNVLHGNCADDTDAIATAAAIANCYGTVLTGQTSGLTEYYGKSISRVGGAHEIKVYDLADPEPRTPVMNQVFGALAANVDDNLPREIALCLSFQGEPTSGANQARRRGRIYLGPFNSSALGGTGSTVDARPLDTMLDDIEIFAQALFDISTWEWGVKSTFSAVLIPVHDGWVDNAFDVQRRRGADPTARQLFTF